MTPQIPDLKGPGEAYFIPNLTRAILHGEAVQVLAVTVHAVSLVRPIAKIRFRSGAMKWVPFDVLASNRAKLEAKLALIEPARTA